MWLAMAGSASMIAHQVAAKAVRDGFFLQQFPANDLPKMMVLAAIASFLLAVLFSRAADRIGPARLVPVCFAFSAGFHLAEWIALGIVPKAVAILIYLHAVGLGAILMSGFWLLLSEVFDLREAKKRFGRIAGAGTAGGIAGGILAERLVAWISTDALLLFLGLLHLACTLIAFRLKPPVRKSHGKPQESTTIRQAFSRTPLLWQLASLVFLGTCTAALLDYLFKLGATLAIGKGPLLVRYFAMYYTACQVLTFLMQTFLARPAVERLGIAKSVASLPVAVGFGSVVALLVPVYPLVIAVRALEVILRGSLFRSGYEFLYTPVPPSDKRAVKTVVDVGFDRMGDAVGAGAVQIMMWLGPALARPEILGLAMVLCALTTILVLRLDRSYQGVLELGLVKRAREEAAADESNAGNSEQDSLMNTMFEGMPSLMGMPGALALRAVGTAPELPSSNAGTPTSGSPAVTESRSLHTPMPASSATVPPAAAAGTSSASRAAVGNAPSPATFGVGLDRTIERMADLRSRDHKRVQRAIAPSEPYDPMLVPQVIRLLAWDAVSHAAGGYLERGAQRILGQINDTLTDQDIDFSIRRRLPRLLARVPVQPSVDGLVAALQDPRFEMRFLCGGALDFMKRRFPELDFRPNEILKAAGRELSVSQAIWNSRRRKAAASDGSTLRSRAAEMNSEVQHAPPAGGGPEPEYHDEFLDDVLRDRADRSLEHVFSLFAVVLPREPLMAAFRALHHEDRMYRGLALEYLETMIPEQIRERLWVVLDLSPPKMSADGEELLDDEERHEEREALARMLETDAALLVRLREEKSKKPPASQTEAKAPAAEAPVVPASDV
jgi:AAA family ATP:ADP antiporter